MPMGFYLNTKWQSAITEDPVYFHIIASVMGSRSVFTQWIAAYQSLQQGKRFFAICSQWVISGNLIH